MSDWPCKKWKSSVRWSAKQVRPTIRTVCRGSVANVSSNLSVFYLARASKLSSWTAETESKNCRS
jgi:hypothetical protein